MKWKRNERHLKEQGISIQLLSVILLIIDIAIKTLKNL